MQCIARFGSVSPISVLMVADDGTFSGTSEAVYLIQTLKGQLKAPVNSVPCQQFYTGYLLGQKVVLAISGEKHPSLPIAPGRPCCFAPPLERPCRDVSAATCNPPKAHASSLQCNSKPESARPPKALSLRAGVLDKSATRLLQYLEKHIMHLHTNCGVLIAAGLCLLLAVTRGAHHTFAILMSKLTVHTAGIGLEAAVVPRSALCRKSQRAN